MTESARRWLPIATQQSTATRWNNRNRIDLVTIVQQSAADLFLTPFMRPMLARHLSFSSPSPSSVYHHRTPKTPLPIRTKTPGRCFSFLILSHLTDLTLLTHLTFVPPNPSKLTSSKDSNF